jgi:5-methylcytosine-specific restriction endonuclease McrA
MAIRCYIKSDEGRAVRHAATARYQRGDQGRRVTRQGARRRREAEYGIRVPVPLGYEDLVHEVFGARCTACGAEGPLALDHHRPLRDGNPLLHNAVPLCQACNARKNQRQPEVFYDGWKLAEITVLLWETRAAFETRFGPGAFAC